jgi:hypothetical protein
MWRPSPTRLSASGSGPLAVRDARGFVTKPTQDKFVGLSPAIRRLMWWNLRSAWTRAGRRGAGDDVIESCGLWRETTTKVGPRGERKEGDTHQRFRALCRRRLFGSSAHALSPGSCAKLGNKFRRLDRESARVCRLLSGRAGTNTTARSVYDRAWLSARRAEDRAFFIPAPNVWFIKARPGPKAERGTAGWGVSCSRRRIDVPTGSRRHTSKY